MRRAKKDRYGDFGNMANFYKIARQNYPSPVFDYLYKQINEEKPNILDLGCGTGIATRQLYKRGARVIGVDKDPRMITASKEDSDSRIIFKTAVCEKLPFKKSVFDCVTAFTAFHWFANPQAVSEIIRVLKPHGLLFIVRKNDITNVFNTYREIFGSFIKKQPVKLNYSDRHEKLLENAGFDLLPQKSFETTEHYSLEQAIAYSQSVSLWNLVLDQDKPKAAKLTTELFQQNLKNGWVERQIKVICDLAVKT